MTDYSEDVMRAARECAAVVPDFFHMWEDEPQFEADKAAEDIAKIIARAITADRKRRTKAMLTSEAVERAAKAVYDGPLCANDEESFGDNSASNWCREVVRAAILAALEFTDGRAP